MRIVGGELRGRTLQSVDGQGTRPTADRVRQSLFDRLGQRCDDLAVLDLYAGTGALAFEALSRGAIRAVLVEENKFALAAIEQNAKTLRVLPRCRVLKDDVTRALAALAARGEKFELVFSDPPYALKNSQAILDRLATAQLVAPSGRVVLERDRHDPAPIPPTGFSLVHEREYGDTALSIFMRE